MDNPILLQRVRETCAQWNRRTQRAKDSKFRTTMSVLFDEVARMDEEAKLRKEAARVAPAPVAPAPAPAPVQAAEPSATAEPETEVEEVRPRGAAALEGQE